MAQFVYTMNRVSKVVPPKREILSDISLSFFPGAKIGVLGLNGAGKSTLLRIMAGVDTEFNGEARPQPGIKIGYLPQEPELDPSKDVRGNVEDGVKRKMRWPSWIKSTPPTPRLTPLMRWPRQAAGRYSGDRCPNLDHKLEVAADALRLPPWDADVTKISVVATAVSRCVACCCRTRICCC